MREQITNDYSLITNPALPLVETDQLVSLSQRERAGVRGKEASTEVEVRKTGEIRPLTSDLGFGIPFVIRHCLGLLIQLKASTLFGATHV
jgi:hypothetical protein